MFVLSEDKFNIKFNVFRKLDEPEVIEPFSHINFISVKRYNAYPQIQCIELHSHSHTYTDTNRWKYKA